MYYRLDTPNPKYSSKNIIIEAKDIDSAGIIAEKILKSFVYGLVKIDKDHMPLTSKDILAEVWYLEDGEFKKGKLVPM